MYLCAKCRFSVSYVYTVHSSDNKVGKDKKKGEEKTEKGIQAHSGLRHILV